MTPRDHSIGFAPGGVAPHREGHQASHATQHCAARRVSVRTNATNAWNQNWHSSNPGYQNNNNKTNANRVRAVRRPKATLHD